jgi:hypothetical protein
MMPGNTPVQLDMLDSPEELALWTRNKIMHDKETVNDTTRSGALHAPLQYIKTEELAEFEIAVIQLSMPLHGLLIGELTYHRREHWRLRTKLADRWGKIRLLTAITALVASWVLIFLAIEYLRRVW